MKKVILFTAICVSLILMAFTFNFKGGKPEALFAGQKKGTIEKLTFIGTRKLDLYNNSKGDWKITGYEFDMSCGGKMFMKYYNTDSIPQEIISMVKNCSDLKFISDFTNIKARNAKTGAEKQLNNITLTVLK